MTEYLNNRQGIRNSYQVNQDLSLRLDEGYDLYNSLLGVSTIRSLLRGVSVHQILVIDKQTPASDRSIDARSNASCSFQLFLTHSTGFFKSR